MLRKARFVELEPLEKDGSDFWETNRYRPELNERRRLTEEMTRVRWGMELPSYEPDELAALVHEAASSGQLALLQCCRREIRRRQRETPGSATAAQIALISAESAIPLPADLEALDKKFSEIDATARRLGEALVEIERGDGKPRDVNESVDRIDELTAEFGAAEAPARYAEEQAAKRAGRKEAAAQQADREV